MKKAIRDTRGAMDFSELQEKVSREYRELARKKKEAEIARKAWQNSVESMMRLPKDHPVILDLEARLKFKRQQLEKGKAVKLSPEEEAYLEAMRRKKD